MKKTILFLLTILFFGLLKAQSPAERQVQQTIMQVFAALSDKDSVSLKSLCTPDVKFYEYGYTWTIDSLISRAITTNAAPDFKRTNRINFINSSISNNVAWATYNLYSEMTANGKTVSIHWMETVILVTEEKKWKIKLLHSTSVKRG